MNDKGIDTPWRHTHELVPAIAWSLGLIIVGTMLLSNNIPKQPMLWLMLVIGVYAVVRWKQTFTNWMRKAYLCGAALTFIKADEFPAVFKDAAKKDELWLGYGFEWKEHHAQVLFDLRRVNPDNIKAPAFIVEWMKRSGKINPAKPEEIGLPWIHGIEPNEQVLGIPFKNLEGHTMVYGTPGSGKTRFADIIIFQCVARNDGPVIIIDPKGDRETERNVRYACEKYGRVYKKFHIALTDESVSIDPLQNWNNPSELTTRITQQLEGSSQSADPFVNFAWRMIDQIIRGMIEIGEKVNLLTIRYYIETGVDTLIRRVIETFCREHMKEGWETDYRRFLKNASKYERPTRSTPLETVAFVEYFSEVVAPKYRNSANESAKIEVINGLISIYKHSREHASKMLAGTLPLLTQLTGGAMGPLLSPESTDDMNGRESLDFKRAIDNDYVVYIGLDTLSNQKVGSVVGSMFLSDIAAVLGSRYNFKSDEELAKDITLIVDEAESVANDALLTLLNKGRGGGLRRAFLFTQTLPDFEAKLGDAAKAMQVMGNLNNLFCLRVKDEKTTEYISALFGMTYVKTMMVSTNTNAISSDRDPTAYTASYGEREDDTEVELFPPDLLSRLRNLEYIANISGGKTIKGRIPILTR